MLALKQLTEIARPSGLLPAGSLVRVDLFQIFAMLALAGWPLRLLTTQQTLFSLTLCRCLPLISRQEPGIKQAIETTPLISTSTQQCAQVPAQLLTIEYAKSLRHPQYIHRVGTTGGKAVRTQKSRKLRQPLTDYLRQRGAVGIQRKPLRCGGQTRDYFPRHAEMIFTGFYQGTQRLHDLLSTVFINY